MLLLWACGPIWAARSYIIHYAGAGERKLFRYGEYKLARYGCLIIGILLVVLFLGYFFFFRLSGGGL